MTEIYLVRHGETEWSRKGRHTGRTDIPLTLHGEAEAQTMSPRLAGLDFTVVLASPLRRARRTCELAGFGDRVRVEPALREWDYGDLEGLTSDEIRGRHAAWDVFEHGCPGGESATEVRPPDIPKLRMRHRREVRWRSRARGEAGCQARRCRAC